MHSNQSSAVSNGTIPLVRRWCVVALLAFAFLAGPAGALCASCCPETASGSTVGAAMPCCDEDCGPVVKTAKPAIPAIVAARAVPDSTLATFLPPGERPQLSPAPGAARRAFLAPSPPLPTGVSGSVLRL